MMKYFKKHILIFSVLLAVFALAACTEVTSTETTTATTTDETTTISETTTVETTTTTTQTTTGVTTDQTTTTSDGSATTTTTEPTGTLETYTFEAEYTDLSSIIGSGYSGTVYGTGVIVEDTKGGGASNGYFVSYLYSYGTTLEFEIESDRAVSDATLHLRFSAEVTDFTLTSDMYTVQVNDMTYTYDDIVFSDVPSMSAEDMHPFNDYTIENVSLQEGTNVVMLTTTNDQPMGGTMYSTAPLVDAIKIETTANLTWTPNEDNIS